MKVRSLVVVFAVGIVLLVTAVPHQGQWGWTEDWRAGSWEYWWEVHRDAYLFPHLNPVPPGGEGTIDSDHADSPSTLDAEEKIDLDEIGKTLRSILAGTDHADLVEACFVTLGRIGGMAGRSDPTLVPRLSSYLSDPRPEIAGAAVVAIVHADQAESVPVLLALTRDTEEGRRLAGAEVVPQRLRTFALYGLGVLARRSGDAELCGTVARIAGAWIDDEPLVTDPAAAAVITMGLTGEGGLGSLRDLLLRDDLPDGLEGHAMTSLAQIVSDRPPSDPDRQRVTRRLVDRLLKSEGIGVECTRSVVLGLGELGYAGYAAVDKEIRAALQGVVWASDDLQARGVALISLAHIGGRHGDDPEQGPIVRKIGDFLLHEAEGHDRDVRPWAILAVGILGHAIADSESGQELLPDLATRLITMLKGERPLETVATIALSLGLLSASEPEGFLRAVLENTDDGEIRGCIVIGLALAGARDAIPALWRTLEASRYRPDLLQHTAMALAILGDRAVAPYLNEALPDREEGATQWAVASAMGLVGDPRSASPLLTFLQRGDVSPRAKAFVVPALGTMVDRESWMQKTGLFDLVNYLVAPRSLDGRSSFEGFINHW